MEVLNNLKQRIISAGVGVCILVSVLFFFSTIVFNIAISLISVMAVYELILATKYIKNNLLAAVSLFFSGLIPWLKLSSVDKLIIPVCSVFILILFVIMLKKYKTVNIKQIGFAFFISVFISFSLSMLVYIRDMFFKEPIVAMFYILMALGSAWISDSGAYFVGTYIGKTKLAPYISPNKTVEGLIGGVIISTLFGLLLSAIFVNISLYFKIYLDINYLKILIVLPVASLVSVLGDLVASLVKRQCSIKDFGSIMPGHGGVLDRFDSVIFSVIFYYLVILFFPLVKI